MDHVSVEERSTRMIRAAARIRSATAAILTFKRDLPLHGRLVFILLLAGASPAHAEYPACVALEAQAASCDFAQWQCKELRSKAFRCSLDEMTRAASAERDAFADKLERQTREDIRAYNENSDREAIERSLNGLGESIDGLSEELRRRK